MSRQQGMEAPALVRARCLWCFGLAQYQPSAFLLRLFDDGSMRLHFFCLHCREESYQVVVDPEMAQALTDAGVRTDLVKPLEWHDPDAPPISSTDVWWFRSITTEYLDVWVKMLCEEGW
jgi:hypothetical protein